MYELNLILIWSDGSYQNVEGFIWGSYEGCMLAGDIIANTLGIMLDATQFQMVCEIPGILI
jgi:hypothetical protein